MKTFKLISLTVIGNESKEIAEKEISVHDGLTINQEDDKARWILEAFIDIRYLDYFKAIKKHEDIVVEIKITKESNEPASFITSIVSIEEIGDKMNVIFVGTIIDQRKDKFVKKLAELIDDGYEGEQLLQQFKQILQT